MQVQVLRASELSFAEGESALVIPVFEKQFPLQSSALDNADELTLQALADKDIFSGKSAECYLLPTPGAAYKNVVVAGLGKAEKFSAETLRRAAGKASSLFTAARVAHVYLDASRHADLPVAAFLEGVILGQYDFDIYKEKKEGDPQPVKVGNLTVIVDDNADTAAVEEAAKLAVVVALSTNGARHLANTAPNELTPSALAAFAQGIAATAQCECYVLEETQMASLGMNALLGVSRGSAQPPRLILLRYHHSDDAKTIALVGKGVTFDSGGISIKPADHMHEMKYDMCGAAAVLCAMMNVVELKPAVNVVCCVPSVENMTGANAQRPGDIVRAYNGKTIEVLNTDAEGRLILADALAFVVDKYKPDIVVDLATLTGAVVVALGAYAAGILGNDDALIEQLRAAGDDTGERLWPLPLWDDYAKLIESPHADLANIGPARTAGAIVGGIFLKEFVGDTPWAHIDIAGTAWDVKNIPYLNPSHATGYGVRLLTKWILGQA